MSKFSKIFFKIFIIVLVVLVFRTLFLIENYIYYSTSSKKIHSNNVKNEYTRNHSNPVRRVNNGKNFEYILVDNDGKQISNDSYSKVESVYKNYYVVYLLDESVGVIDNTGKYILEPKFSKITECGNNLFCTYDNTNNGKSEIYDIKGNLLLKDKYIKPVGLKINHLLGKNYIFVSDTKIEKDEYKKISLFDGNLNKLLTFDTERWVNLYSDNYIVTYYSKNKKLIDFKGRTIIEPNYDYIGKITHYNNKTYFIVGNQERYGVVDTKNKIIIPLEYKFIYFPEDKGVIWAARKDKNGFSNVSIFDCFDFSGNLIQNPDLSTSPNGQYTILASDKRLKELRSKYFHIYGMGTNYYVVTSNHKTGIVDIDNNVYVPVKYVNCDVKDHHGAFVCASNYVGLCGTSLPTGETCKGIYDVYDTNKHKICSAVSRNQVDSCINKSYIKCDVMKPILNPPIHKMYNEFPREETNVYKRTQKTLLFSDKNIVKINENGLSIKRKVVID